MGIKKEAIGEAINLGSGNETRVIDMANMVNELTGNPEGIAYASRRNWDAKTRLLSSIEKAEKILNYKPQTKFKDGLKKTHQWFQITGKTLKKVQNSSDKSMNILVVQESDWIKQKSTPTTPSNGTIIHERPQCQGDRLSH